MGIIQIASFPFFKCVVVRLREKTHQSGLKKAGGKTPDAFISAADVLILMEEAHVCQTDDLKWLS